MNNDKVEELFEDMKKRNPLRFYMLEGIAKMFEDKLCIEHLYSCRLLFPGEDENKKTNTDRE